MSDQSERGGRRPGAGASGTPGSIGKALGGDLDFEPDALLDSLTEADEALPTGRPPAPSTHVVDDSELLEGERLSYSDEEVTQVGQREAFEAFEPVQSPAHPSPGAVRGPPAVPRPLSGSSSKAPGLVPRPASTAAAPRPAARPAAPRAAAPPAAPSPPAPETGSASPPEASESPRAAQKGPGDPTLGPTPVGPYPSSAPPTERVSRAPATDERKADASDDDSRTSLTAEEIDALEELDDIVVQRTSLPPTPPPTPPPSRSPTPARAFPAGLPPAAFAPRPGAVAPQASRPPAPLASRSDRPLSFLTSSVPPDDKAPLPRVGEPHEWHVRAAWMEAEARRILDAHSRARALVAASELWAIAGDVDRARRAAQDAHTAGRTAVAGRQLRSLAATSGDWKTVASLLEIELRGSTTEAARTHATLLDAEVHRLCLADETRSKERLELARQAAPSDARAAVATLASMLASGPAAPELELPDGDELADLKKALAEIARVRRADGDPSDQGALAAFAIARRALASGDRRRAAQALDEIAKVDWLGESASFLKAALLAHDAATRAESLTLLQTLALGSDAKGARRALAARALELGDRAALEAAMSGREEAFSSEDRLALAALSGEPDAVEAAAEAATAEALAPLRAAARAAIGKPTPEAGSERSRAAAALGRAIGKTQSGRLAQSLAGPLADFVASEPAHAAARFLAIELALAGGEARAVARETAALPSPDGNADRNRDRALVNALLFELAGELDSARDAYRSALDADHDFEAALRARLPALSDVEAARALAALADGSNDPTQAALLLVEAALKENDPRQADEWLKRSATLDPALELAFRHGEQDARQRGDVERLLDWLRARREATSDEVVRAFGLVREALLTSETDPNGAAELLDTAITAHPGDVGLRELSERLRPGDQTARGGWREAAAEHASEAARIQLLLEAAFEYERARDRASAARTARRAAELGAGDLASLTAQRTAAGTPEAARVSEDLLTRAKAAEDPASERELYQELSDFDRAQGDHASALLWQAAILERSPDSLSALRQLEHAYISSAREDELEPVATALARVLPDGEGIAHARLGARLKLKAGAWAGRRELAELALARDPECLWALRALAAHARADDEPERALDIYRRLDDLVVHPLDKASLSLRAAEAAARLGRLEEAKALLEAALESAPDHLVALTTLAEVLEGQRDFAGSARAMEALAEASRVDAHRVQAWHHAATLWLDKVGDLERARATLEETIALDPAHEDAVVRLQNLLLSQGDHPALAVLLERRIDLAGDTEERIALEVQRGRLLAGVGETTAARSALSAALDANPDHADALDALGELCAAEGDWSGAEQAFIRLVRHVSDQERQAAIYRKLGELYDVHLPNPERSELAHLEVLKRVPDDTATIERLIQVYGQRGQKDRAVELQSSLLERATTPEQKRDRTLGLALVFEQIVGDRKRAEATLDKLRRELPQDMAVLRALVEHHRRGEEHRPAQVLIDRVASEARRALSTGRFELALFEMLGTAFDLRGEADAALVTEATLAALAGEPFPVRGAGVLSADVRLDELLAPELVTPALRALLRRAGDVLDAAYTLDPKTLRAVPFPAENADRVEQIREVAKAFGLSGVETLISPALGGACLAARSVPPQLVYGSALLEKATDAQRYFLLIRALKLLQGRAATLARTAPIDLGPIVAAFLSVVANYEPEGVDARRFEEAKRRIKQAVISPFDGETSMLALEVVGSLGSRASQLATALSCWANRTALLAVGNPLTGLRALALMSGAELPLEGPERLKWIARNPEARDLAVFSVSEQYVEARKRAGVQG